MKNKRVITCALTGAVHIPSMSPYLPITTDEIIKSGVEAADAGAAIVHVHARIPETGEPTNDPTLIGEIVNGIKKETDAIICVTTGGKLGSTTSERLAAVPTLRPEIASCNAGSFNFNISGIAQKIKEPKYDWEIPYVENTYDHIFANTFQGIEDYILTMNEFNTKPEFEIYDVGMISNVAYFLNKGMIKGPVYIQFVMGIAGGIPATVENLLFLLNTAKKELGNNFVWSVGAAGKVQFELTTVAMILGGNARVGLEDNLYLGKGQLAKSNAETVEKIKGIAESLGYELATPDESREMLGINSRIKNL